MRQVRPTEYNEDGSIKRSGLDSSESSSIRLHGVGVFEEVIAPDGTRIANRHQMAEFTKRTGLTNDMGSLMSMAEKQKNRTITSNPEGRKEAIRDSIERASSSGYRREMRYE